MVFSRIVTKYKCCGCNVIDYHEAKRYFQVRICEHLGISHLTSKTMKIDKNKVTLIQEHDGNCCNYCILTTENNGLKLRKCSHLKMSAI